MNIDQLQPGRELDILIAEKIFGHMMNEDHIVKWAQISDDDWEPSFEPCPHYSTSIADAWQVVEKMKELGAEINIGFYEKWDCEFDYPIGCNWRAVAETAPEAICKAALIAILCGESE